AVVVDELGTGRGRQVGGGVASRRALVEVGVGADLALVVGVATPVAALVEVVDLHAVLPGREEAARWGGSLSRIETAGQLIGVSPCQMRRSTIRRWIPRSAWKSSRRVSTKMVSTRVPAITAGYGIAST